MTEKHPEVLVAPTVTFLAVVGLIGIARVYDGLPTQAPDCRFLSIFGIPCVSCGGTRAFQSLSHGHLLDAIQFNPAAILGVGAALIWFIVGLTRYHRGMDLKGNPRKMSTKKLILILFLMLGFNWAYLILFLP